MDLIIEMRRKVERDKYIGSMRRRTIEKRIPERKGKIISKKPFCTNQVHL
jgi:hypothetical protein